MDTLHSKIQVVPAIPPATVSDNTATASSIIDTFGFGSCEFVITLGALADANATFAVTMEHGDDSGLSDTAAVTSANLQGTLAAAGFQYNDDNKVRRVGYRKGKRYVRLTITPSGNSDAATFGAVAVLGSPTVSPTANP